MKKDELESKYRSEYRPLFEVLAERIADLVDGLMEQRGIPIAQVEHRAKSIDSVLSKSERKSYKNPLEEIKDFAGVRIMTYYNDDVSRVSSLIYDEFEVDPEHSTDKLDELAVDEFGYRSFHLVCSLKEPRVSLPEWEKFVGLSFEVQIRSVLQHAWAAISHKLDYKSASQAPRELRRQLFRLSALLELADEEFSVIRDRSFQITEVYRKNVDQGDLEIPLNVDSLNEYLKERVDLAQWEKIGKEIEMKPSTEEDVEWRVKTLFKTLESLGVHSIAEIDSLLIKHAPKSRTALSRIKKEVKKEGFDFEADPIDIINVMIAFGERKRFPPDFEWPGNGYWREQIKNAMDRLIHPPIKKDDKDQ